MYPIVGITAKAGGGKDTIAGFMVKNHEAQAIALADPMKRLAEMVYLFTEDQLWGPSESRNAPDARFDGPLSAKAQAFNEASDRLYAKGEAWIADIMPDATIEAKHEAFWQLKNWCTAVAAHFLASREVLTPRYVLQTLGTEWGRNFSKNLWIDYALRTAKELLNGDRLYDRRTGLMTPACSAAIRQALLRHFPRGRPVLVVITDVRFANEVLAIILSGGQMMRLYSNEGTGLLGSAGQHLSEKEMESIPDAWMNILFENDKREGLATAESKLKTAMKHLGF